MASQDPQIKKHNFLHHFSTKHQSKATYTIFYASVDSQTQKMWCPDCEDAAPLLSSIFNISSTTTTTLGDLSNPYGSADRDAAPDSAKPTAEIRYVGSRQEWRFEEGNVFKNPPFEIKKLPTVLKFRDGKVIGRLEEGEVFDGERMEGFLGA